ncbi:hypothetical protein J3A78_000114 [Streptomyces sp. PvR006]|nr:hypothetical protein [Streptomyces sp. PvR006]
MADTAIVLLKRAELTRSASAPLPGSATARETVHQAPPSVRCGRWCVKEGKGRVGRCTLSAQRTGAQGTSVTLKSGKSVAFAISCPVHKTGGSGIRITGLLVTPPNETKTVTLAWPGAATLPVTEGPGSRVKVGPIGSAGQGG